METEEKRSFLSPAHTEKKPVAEPAELTQCVHTDFAHCQGTEEKKKNGKMTSSPASPQPLGKCR